MICWFLLSAQRPEFCFLFWTFFIRIQHTQPKWQIIHPFCVWFRGCVEFFEPVAGIPLETEELPYLLRAVLLHSGGSCRTRSSLIGCRSEQGTEFRIMEGTAGWLVYPVHPEQSTHSTTYWDFSCICRLKESKYFSFFPSWMIPWDFNTLKLNFKVQGALIQRHCLEKRVFWGTGVEASCWVRIGPKSKHKWRWRNQLELCTRQFPKHDPIFQSQYQFHAEGIQKDCPFQSINVGPQPWGELLVFRICWAVLLNARIVF